MKVALDMQVVPFALPDAITVILPHDKTLDVLLTDLSEEEVLDVADSLVDDFLAHVNKLREAAGMNPVARYGNNPNQGDEE